MRPENIVLQERVQGIVEPLIPKGAHQRVLRAVTEANQMAREHIRTETGLRLSSTERRTSVPVRVVEGFPAPLAYLIDEHDDPVLWRLLLIQPKMAGVVEGLDMVLKDWERLEGILTLPKAPFTAYDALGYTREVAFQLQKLKLAQDVWKGIAQIEEDILGTYQQLPGGVNVIEVYWMPVALISGMLGVTMEDLAVVTLTHELGHAYTHLGCDIDGRSWDDDGFWHGAKLVIEGLAQFYTQLVAEKMGDKRPGMRTAFDRLLARQHCVYKCFNAWLPTDTNRAEGVRVAMLAARNRDCVDYEGWLALLTQTQAHLKPQKKQEGKRD